MHFNLTALSTNLNSPICALHETIPIVSFTRKTNGSLLTSLMLKCVSSKSCCASLRRCTTCARSMSTYTVIESNMIWFWITQWAVIRYLPILVPYSCVLLKERTPSWIPTPSWERYASACDFALCTFPTLASVNLLFVFTRTAGAAPEAFSKSEFFSVQMRQCVCRATGSYTKLIGFSLIVPQTNRHKLRAHWQCLICFASPTQRSQPTHRELDCGTTPARKLVDTDGVHCEKSQ